MIETTLFSMFEDLDEYTTKHHDPLRAHQDTNAHTHSNQTARLCLGHGTQHATSHHAESWFIVTRYTEETLVCKRRAIKQDFSQCPATRDVPTHLKHARNVLDPAGYKQKPTATCNRLHTGKRTNTSAERGKQAQTIFLIGVCHLGPKIRILTLILMP